MNRRFRRYGGLLMVGIAASCARGPSQREFEQRPEEEREALATISLGTPISLDGAVFLPPPAVTLHREGRPVPYREAKEPVRLEKEGLVFQLQSLFDGPSMIRYQVIDNREQDETTLRFWSDKTLPDLTLQSLAPGGLVPVRLEPSTAGEDALSVAGPAMFAACTALYDVRRDMAIAIDQPFQYTTESGRPNSGLLGIRISGAGREARVRFRATKNVLKERLKSITPAGVRQAAASAPADWYVLSPFTTASAPATTPDLAAWSAANLSVPGQALITLPAGGGLPAALCSSPVMAAPDSPAPAPALPPGWKKRFDRMKDIYGRVIERGERYNWQHARELMGTTMDGCWAHGIVRTEVTGPLLLGPPLSLEHARMWASLAALSGQGIAIGGDVTMLPAERVDLLRAVVPPGPIRSADLYAHTAPQRWVVTGTRPIAFADGFVFEEPCATVGVFNWSLEPRTAELRLADVMPGLKAQAGQTDGVLFAVFDFWENRLYGMTREAVSVPLPPASSRVFQVIPIAADRPTIIAAGPRLFPLPADARDLTWHRDAFTWSGTSTVTAGQPIELRFLLPESARSFDIAEIVAPGAQVQVRIDGLLRSITLQSDALAEVHWSIRFLSAPQQLAAPPAPNNLTAAQNTRGALLSWHGRDGAVRYRVYRDGQALAETCAPTFQDSTARYGQAFVYAVSAVEFAGRESDRSDPVQHRTPLPASANLTDLVPLVAEQEHLAVMNDLSAAGNPMRIAGKRYHRGLGTHSRARLVYFLGGGYETFSGEAGIDDETNGQGSCTFKILADGQPLFTSSVLRGGMAAQPFSVPVAGRMTLELIVTDGGDHPDNDHADWGNPYLEVKPR